MKCLIPYSPTVGASHSFAVPQATTAYHAQDMLLTSTSTDMLSLHSLRIQKASVP